MNQQKTPAEPLLSGDLFGLFFRHKKTGRVVEVLNHCPNHWDFVELRYLHTGRTGRKRRHYFDYDYPARCDGPNTGDVARPAAQKKE
jgi:hypothetical protein